MKIRILVIVEPTRSRHYALERALVGSALDKNSVELHVLLAANPGATDAPKPEDPVFRDRDWFLDLIKPLDESGLDYTIRITWSPEYRKAILALADEVNPDIIMMPATERIGSGGSRFSDAKWELIRNAPCPVVVIQPGAKPRREVVLAAVRLQTDGADKYADLNERILAESRIVAKMYGADLHVVNAYKSLEDIPDRGAILRETGLPNDKVHLEPGAPAAVLTAVATRINADLVVIGTRRRSGLAAAMRGNTSERLIGELTQDVVLIN